MSVRAAMACWADEVARASRDMGHQVRIDPLEVMDRSGELPLGRAGLWSPNRSCRLVAAADGWLAVNLPRPDDRDMVPALLGREVSGDPWRAIVRDVRQRPASALLAQARLLGLAVAVVGEAAGQGPPVATMPLGTPEVRTRPPRVADLTTMWAGPLCAGLLAEAGAHVTRYHDRRRPDPMQLSTPALYARLNKHKHHVLVDFATASGRTAIKDAIARADIVVTSARPRAFAAMGLGPQAMAALNPGLLWVAITGHGWSGAQADRIAFGDDAAAAGGLLRYTPAGSPRFAGDALADPLTGLAAAAVAMRAWAAGGGVLIDAALSRVAAAAAQGAQG